MERFEWPAVASGLLDLYASLLRDGVAGPAPQPVLAAP